MNLHKGFNSVGITVFVICVAVGLAGAVLMRMPLIAVVFALAGLYLDG